MTTGSTIATLEYDGLGRRIEKKVENSADWNGTYHYYYYDQRMVEVRRDFGGETPNFRVVKQYAWGTQYIDELVWVGVNIDPDDPNESNGGACERWFWALHDVNYNVIGLTATVGSPVWVEQYEYTPYGERTVYSRNWLLADVDEDGDVDDDDEWLSTAADAPLAGGGRRPPLGECVGHTSSTLLRFCFAVRRLNQVVASTPSIFGTFARISKPLTVLPAQAEPVQPSGQ